ncbi:MAG: nucleotidyltransferase domain-containing protein [Candidatus Aenigmarchaeota archaeon]|nr:nucleotidyltransferase domain-containing protein [Candidatus Aenigmarchaeota archaeon]
MILAYIYDFVSFIFEKDLKKDIKSIILYGSVASGEFDDESDIDLFIDIWNAGKRQEIEKKVKEQLDNFEDKAARTWHPRGIKNSFSIIVGDINSPKWENLKHDVISNGMHLYGKYESLPKNIQHKVLITFSLAGLPQKKKMKFSRHLYGYELSKNGKKYLQQGILQKHSGTKISSNSILVPLEKVKDFRKHMSDFNVTPQMREVWIKS